MRFQLSLGSTLLLLGLAVSTVACTSDETIVPVGTTSVATTGASSSTGTGGAGGMPDPTMTTIKTLSGDATWTVTFDADAQAAGATNCAYTRHYEAVEDASAQWLCPSCEVMYRADVTLTAGATDCFPQVSPNPPSKVEWIGYGGGRYFRGIGPTSDQGAATVTATDVSVVNTITMNPAPAGGTLDFDVAAQFTIGSTTGDVLNGFRPPETYACGWPKANLPPYTGDYTIQLGGTMPDGLLKDACDETVRLHDFAGSYLIVEMAARDCPPCQAMADAEEQFVADMAAQGITVHMVTLLAPSLSDTLGNTTKSMLDGWINKFDLTTSAVLADRGWGLAIFEPAIGADNIGYPSWVLVDPNLKVIDFQSGFSDFTSFETAILADAQP